MTTVTIIEQPSVERQFFRDWLREQPLERRQVIEAAERDYLKDRRRETSRLATLERTFEETLRGYVWDE